MFQKCKTVYNQIKNFSTTQTVGCLLDQIDALIEGIKNRQSVDMISPSSADQGTASELASRNIDQEYPIPVSNFLTLLKDIKAVTNEYEHQDMILRFFRLSYLVDLVYGFEKKLIEIAADMKFKLVHSGDIQSCYNHDYAHIGKQLSSQLKDSPSLEEAAQILQVQKYVLERTLAGVSIADIRDSALESSIKEALYKLKRQVEVEMESRNRGAKAGVSFSTRPTQITPMYAYSDSNYQMSKVKSELYRPPPDTPTNDRTNGLCYKVSKHILIICVVLLLILFLAIAVPILANMNNSNSNGNSTIPTTPNGNCLSRTYSINNTKIQTINGTAFAQIDPNIFDFLVLDASVNFNLTTDGLDLILGPPIEGQSQGVTIGTTRAMNSGKISIKLKSVAVNGVVTTLKTLAPNGESISFDIYGSKTSKISLLTIVPSTNVAYLLNSSSPSALFPLREISSGLTPDEHTYTIDWHPNQIKWLVDNTTIRTFNKQNGLGFPSAPANVVFGISDGGKSDVIGLSGRVDWAQSLSKYSAIVKELSIECY